MVLVYTVQGALILLVALFVVGFCGLRMCRAMLRSPTHIDLRRAAVSSMLKPGSFSCLNSHQRAAVFVALYECGTRQDVLKRPGLFRGSRGFNDFRK